MADSNILTAVTDYYHNNAICSVIVSLMLTLDPSPTVSLIYQCLSVLLVHAEWLGFLIIFCPLLPQLMERTGSQMSYEGSTFIGKLEELSLSALPLELLLLVVVVGGCTVVAAALPRIASSLHSSRRQWREWKETHGNCGRQKGVLADFAS